MLSRPSRAGVRGKGHNRLMRRLWPFPRTPAREGRDSIPAPKEYRYWSVLSPACGSVREAPGGILVLGGTVGRLRRWTGYRC